MLNVRDISEVLSELEEQEEPKEESNNSSNKLDQRMIIVSPLRMVKRTRMIVMVMEMVIPMVMKISLALTMFSSKDRQLRLSQRSLSSTSTTHSS